MVKGEVLQCGYIGERVKLKKLATFLEGVSDVLTKIDDGRN